MGFFSRLTSLCFGNEAESIALGERFAKKRGHPPGATFTAQGVHFSVYSRNASAVQVCLYEPSKPSREAARVSMTRDENDMWHVFVPHVPGGTLYGFRADGPWSPERGLWFNAHKLLLDPYAKAIHGEPSWQPHQQNIGADGGPDPQDNGRAALKSVVIDDTFDWGDDAPPCTAWQDSIIYEAHVRGFTKQHPDIPGELRGTYAGLAHPAAIAYLKDLGVTAVQLLPVHEHLDDGFLTGRGLTNYWGYSTIGFFAPHSEHASARQPQSQVDEFKAMVRELHRAGIEVILDVVFNHTAEGDENGPNLFLRGLDNPSYYMINGDARVMNYTGCGNTVNAASPPALRLIMDSLRYWVEEMHVDGYRFDLAATLGRRGEMFDYHAPFFQAVAQDPVLQRVKLIAEPWDIGPNGYQIGGFPKPWHELNGRYRDDTRGFWKGDSGITSDMAKRLCGSQDIFGPAGRSPLTTVNMITSHDGFPLRDLWSYNHKHNEANGESNCDGDDRNHSWTCGVEGETEFGSVTLLRRKLARACLATMFCSIGVPFLMAGDERWRTQRGSNNAYCQDNATSWLDWSADDDAAQMLTFVRQLIRFRKTHPPLRRTKYFDGNINPVTKRPDVEWLDAQGGPMTHETWHASGTRFFAALLDAVTDRKVDKSVPLLLLFNSSAGDIPFPMPAGKWSLVFDTSREPTFSQSPEVCPPIFPSGARSVACLMLRR